MSRSNLSSLATLSVSTRSRKRSDPLLGPTGKSDWEDGGGADRRHPKPIEPPELAITAGEQQTRLALSAQATHQLRAEDLSPRHAERSRERPRRGRRLMRVERPRQTLATFQQHLARPEDNRALRHILGIFSLLAR